MTIQEAKTKICPFIENKGKDVTYSDFRDVPKNIHCLCEKCMAWEFNDQCASGSTTVKSTSDGYCKRLLCGS